MMEEKGFECKGIGQRLRIGRVSSTYRMQRTRAIACTFKGAKAGAIPEARAGLVAVGSIEFQDRKMCFVFVPTETTDFPPSPHYFQALRVLTYVICIIVYVVRIVQNKSRDVGGDVGNSIILPGVPSPGLGDTSAHYGYTSKHLCHEPRGGRCGIKD